MARLVTLISGSPSAPSRTARALTVVAEALGGRGFDCQLVEARSADETALERIADSAAVVVGTPVYRATFTGALKAFLDQLPSEALAEQAALPLAVGAAPAHSLAVDQALAPLLFALGADAVVRGLYLVDKQVDEPGSAQALHAAAGRLARFLA